VIPSILLRAGSSLPLSLENRLYIALRFAARKPAAQGKGLFFLYPALTSQRVRKDRVHAGSTCWATIFRPSGAGASRCERNDTDFHLLGWAEADEALRAGSSLPLWAARSLRYAHLEVTSSDAAITAQVKALADDPNLEARTDDALFI
jgi:hypothetical protein